MLTRYFHFFAPLAGLLGYLFAAPIAELRPLLVPMLMLVMLCMGLTLSPQDFKALRDKKTAVVTGLILQFSVMPLVAIALSRLFGLDDDLTVGMVLLGSVAGGVASNVITFIANGYVALSVCMTACSTLLSIVMTPLLLSLLVGTDIDVPALAMLQNLAKIILLPIALGMLLRHFFWNAINSVSKAFPELSVLVILIIIAAIVALNQDNINPGVALLALATLLHNVLGLGFGYGIAKLIGYDPRTCRTIAIEVGMQNSAMASTLAVQYFSALAALPGAIFSVWLNITGSIFARWSKAKDTATN